MSIGFFLIVGLFAGSVAGLVGVGGGVVTVPFLYWLLVSAGFSEQSSFNVARGTSLAIMVLTSASSAWGHRSLGHVDRGLAIRFALIGIPGVLAGSVAGTWMDAATARTVFALVAVAMGARFLLIRGQETELASRVRTGRGAWVWIMGFFVGAFSAFLGIGGGTIAVPVMIVLLGMEAHRAVGTSAALIVVVALFGAISYTALGWREMSDVPHMAGFVHVPALIAIAATSVISANLSARLTGRLSGAWVRRIFGLYMLAVGIRLLAPLLG